MPFGVGVETCGACVTNGRGGPGDLARGLVFSGGLEIFDVDVLEQVLGLFYRGDDLGECHVGGARCGIDRCRCWCRRGRRLSERNVLDPRGRRLVIDEQFGRDRRDDHQRSGDGGKLHDEPAAKMAEP